MKSETVKKLFVYILTLICAFAVTFANGAPAWADEVQSGGTEASEEILPQGTDKAADPGSSAERETPEIRKVLFIGNSYTRYNDMPQLFKRLCDNAGLKVEVTSIAIDSYTLYDLVSLSSVQRALKTGGFDLVIMQEQSDTVLTVKQIAAAASAAQDQAKGEEKKTSSPLVADVLSAIDTVSVIKAAMRMAPEDTKFFLYETMSYNGEPQNQALFTEAYELAGELTGAEVIPAGRAFWEYAETYPFINMFLDDQHPALAGSEVVAKSVFDALWTDLNAYVSLAVRNPEISLCATQVMPLDVRNVAEGGLTFVSSDPQVAEVSENGLVTANGFGTAYITVTNSVGASARAVVNVGFRDVVKNVVSDAIYNAVVWGSGRGIINGFNGGEYFGTEMSCTRGQFVVFLWRLAGRPEVSGSENFSDVDESMSICPAIIWAVNVGIIKGYDDGTFRPDAIVTRRHVAIMLWRWCGRPTPSRTDSKFADMEPDDTSFKAVLWGEENGIMKGAYGYFNPDDDCLRCHIIIFLHRYAQKYLQDA